ncbi:hypothetical protein GCM10008014_22620 [Paenibacillus silvae]|uniref:Uncharacterized protein n=1 Tax=Paenibacillus silvae TaxID=1325358 RepID=A0ABQ1Z8X1_9BACL|nr:hypothetical protein GCM10008014_22620 [Paenibacillus silvae]
MESGIQTQTWIYNGMNKETQFRVQQSFQARSSHWSHTIPIAESGHTNPLIAQPLG